ncbi:hypothetical protein TYRP_011818 [Tyrophagus putrescentiae]|nr:hypothetical protein TYRP_011818 [Tyrophagus putrescentiae]
MTHSDSKQQQLLLPVTIPSTAITIEHCPLTYSSPYSETTEAIPQQPSAKSYLFRIEKKVALQYLSIFLLVSLVGMGIFASTAHNGPWSAIEEANNSEQKAVVQAAIPPPCPCSHSAPTIPAQVLTTTKAATAAAVPKLPKKSPKKPKPKVQFHMRMFP